MVDKAIDQLCRAFGFLMVVSLALMVVMVFGNVVLRYGFNSGITVSEELSRWLFVWLTFLGAVVGVRNHTHLGTDSLVRRLPLLGKKICYVVAHVLMLALCWFMFIGAWQQTKINIASTSAVMEASMGWFYAAGLVFPALAALILLFELWRVATGGLQESDLVAVAESEDVPHETHEPAAVEGSKK